MNMPLSLRPYVTQNTRRNIGMHVTFLLKQDHYQHDQNMSNTQKPMLVTLVPPHSHTHMSLEFPGSFELRKRIANAAHRVLKQPRATIDDARPGSWHTPLLMCPRAGPLKHVKTGGFHGGHRQTALVYHQMLGNSEHVWEVWWHA